MVQNISSDSHPTGVAQPTGQEVFLVKLGDEGYTELAQARRQGLDFDGYHVYYKGVRYAPFPAIEVLEKGGDNGSPGDDAVFRTLSGKAYRVCA